MCEETLAAADVIADAIEAECMTASEEVTRVQKALADSDYRNLAHECLRWCTEVHGCGAVLHAGGRAARQHVDLLRRLRPVRRTEHIEDHE